MLLAACGDDASRSATASAGEPSEETIPFRIDGTLDFLRQDERLTSIDIEIAEGDSATSRGMMQRTAFPDDTGMLFLFDNVQIRTFWMGNTPLSLDLLFIDPDSQIVDFAKYATPFSDEPITSSVPSRFVLEMPAGFVDSQGLVEGDRVRWRRTDG
jgi:hypothetical protein